ncbi:MAG: NUDIX hydrolase [Candidatus Acidiferrales bacterium]
MKRQRERKKARVLRSRVVYRGEIFRVRQDLVAEPRPGSRRLGRAVVRDIVEHKGSVVVLPVLADGRILLVRQFRHATGGFLWELVAGGIDAGETPLQAARRELAEETGYVARRLERLASYFPTPGFLSEVMHVYRGTKLRPGRAQPEEDEALEVRAFSRADLEKMLRGKSLRDGKTILGLLLHWSGTPRRR